MNNTLTILKPGVTNWDLGMIPEWLNFLPEGTPIQEWFNQCYAHGGGWQPFKGFTLRSSDKALVFPGDPPQLPFAKIELSERPEVVYIYPSSWVAIIHPDDSFEVCRMD